MATFFFGRIMFVEARVLSCIEKLKDSLKDIQAFEDPVKKSRAAGIRVRKSLRVVEDDLQSIRQEIMAIRKARVARGEKKTL